MMRAVALKSDPVQVIQRTGLQQFLIFELKRAQWYNPNSVGVEHSSHVSDTRDTSQLMLAVGRVT